jgi:hypothetical protein
LAQPDGAATIASLPAVVIGRPEKGRPVPVGTEGGPNEVQLRFETELTFEEYATERGWERATLRRCPFHPAGGCGLSAHGTYMRKVPSVASVARWYCPQARATIGLLPDFYASRMPGTLDAIEETVARVEESATIEKAAEELRPAEAPDAVTLPTAVRWVRRRLELVKAVLLAVLGLFADLLGPGPPTMTQVRERLGTQRALVALRGITASHLHVLPVPLGLVPPPGVWGRFQQSTGSDPPPASR